MKKKLIKTILIVALILIIAGGYVIYQVSALKDDLLFGGIWPEDKIVHSGLSWAKYGVNSPLQEWSIKYPEVVYAPSDEIILIVREVDFTPSSVQLRQAGTGNTISTITYYNNGRRVYSPIHPDYIISDISLKDDRFFITFDKRNKPDNQKDSFVADFTTKEVIDFIENKMVAENVGKPYLEQERLRVEYLKNK